jgi:hypothetical protein
MNHINLIKLSVGSEKIADLANWQNMVARRRAARGQPPMPVHVTRMFPKKREELLLGGSLYWVIKGQVLCRQRIVDLFEEVGDDGIARCGIRLDVDLVETNPVPRKPFQGWRYLKPEDAPADLATTGGEEIPEAIRRELRDLGAW